MPDALTSYLLSFKNLPYTEQEIIGKYFIKQTYQDSETLFHSGNICRDLFFICNGVLRIMVINEKGNEVTHYFLKENQFCTILNSFTHEVVAQESIEAACDTEVLAISKSHLTELYKQLPYLEAIINQIIQLGLMNKIQTRNSYLGCDSTERYRLFLERQPEIAKRVSLTDIASYLGITPQSLSRIRKNIAKQ